LIKRKNIQNKYVSSCISFKNMKKTTLENQFKEFEFNREYLLYQLKLFFSFMDLFLKEIF